jgi:hypothetical protein
VESGGYPSEQVDGGHRLLGEVVGVEDDQVTAVGRGVVDVRHEPAGAARLIVGGGEGRLAREASRREVVAGDARLAEVVPVDRGTRLVRVVLREFRDGRRGGVAEVGGQARESVVDAGELPRVVVQLLLSERRS